MIAWKKSIPANSPADTQVNKLMRTGQVNNMLYMIYSPNEGNLDAVKQTLDPQK